MDVAKTRGGEEMTRNVLETDDQGNPTVILYTESPDDLAADLDERREQSARADEVAKSLSLASH